LLVVRAVVGDDGIGDSAKLAGGVPLVDVPKADAGRHQISPGHAVLVVMHGASLDGVGPSLHERSGAFRRLENDDPRAALDREPVRPSLLPPPAHVPGDDDDTHVARDPRHRRDVAVDDAIHIHQHDRLARVGVHGLHP
jgi:hypothetical protein